MMKGIKRSVLDIWMLVVALVFFGYVIWYSVTTDFYYYIWDSAVSIIATIAIFLLYEKLRMNWFTFFWVIVGFVLHDFGAFRFYANPPVPFEWDIVTHVVGVFAAALVVYNLVLGLAGGRHSVSLFFVVILAAAGFGVVIEFMEFYGFMRTGFGEGFLGRGFGDFDPRFVSSDYIDTIQDLIWNMVGAVAGFVVAYLYEKGQKLFKFESILCL